LVHSTELTASLPGMIST